MKKDRNAFFGESSMFQSSYMPGPNMMGPAMMQNPAPYQSSGFAQNMYAGQNPGMPTMMGPQTSSPANVYPGDYGMSNNMESRLAKLERQVMRLETRVNKLESTTSTASYNNSHDDIDITQSNSMYMI